MRRFIFVTPILDKNKVIVNLNYVQQVRERRAYRELIFHNGDCMEVKETIDELAEKGIID